MLSAHGDNGHLAAMYDLNTVWKQAIHSKNWRENFPATEIELLSMA